MLQIIEFKDMTELQTINTISPDKLVFETSLRNFQDPDTDFLRNVYNTYPEELKKFWFGTTDIHTKCCMEERILEAKLKKLQQQAFPIRDAIPGDAKFIIETVDMESKAEFHSLQQELLRHDTLTNCTLTEEYLEESILSADVIIMAALKIHPRTPASTRPIC